MKKLLTLIVTLCIFFIGFTSVKAIETITTQAQTGRIEYYDSNNVLQYNTVSCSANRCTFQNTNYNQLNAFWFYFSSNQSTFSSHLVFTGSVTFETELDLTQDSFVNYLPESISSIGLMAGNGVTRTGSCTLNNLIQTNSNNLLGQTTNPVHNVYGKTYNFTVDCLTESILNSGQNQNILQFYINSPRFPQNDVLVTSIELNTYTIGYNGEYTDDIQSLINAINNITINGATVNVDQTPVTNAIENSTQQIVDQLQTDNSSVCDNLYNVVNDNRNYNGITWHCSNQKCSMSGKSTSSGNNSLFLASGWARSVPAGTYNIILTQPIAYDFYPIDQNTPSCKISAGQTSTTCTTNSTKDFKMLAYFNTTSQISYTDLGVYLGISNSYCAYGSEVIDKTNKLDDINSSIQQTNDYLTEDPTTKVDNLSDTIETRLSNISDQQDQFHLLDFIRFPLYILQGINNSTDECMNGINLPLPFVSRYLYIPCMGYYMHTHFGLLVDFYQMTITAFTYYYIFRNIWKKLSTVANFNIQAEEL